jgi:ATP-binding cassette, subfamily B, bacterial HlyB/CyaB
LWSSRGIYRLDGPAALNDISLKSSVGQVIDIVGPSDSGKSTLTKLVQRLYVPESGRILIDGFDLTVADVAWLRRQIGSVLQENVLFNTPIRDNIALADPGMSMERVIAAAELAAPTILFSNCRIDIALRRASAARACRAGSASQRIAIARARHQLQNPDLR